MDPSWGFLFKKELVDPIDELHFFLPGSSSLGAGWIIRVAYVAEKHHPLGFKQHPLEYFRGNIKFETSVENGPKMAEAHH